MLKTLIIVDLVVIAALVAVFFLGVYVGRNTKSKKDKNNRKEFKK